MIAYNVLEKGQQKSLQTGRKGAHGEEFQGEKYFRWDGNSYTKQYKVHNTILSSCGIKIEKCHSG